MSEKSAIEWTDATWNPTTGCTKISPGCAHCYIERTPPFRIHRRTFVNGYIPVELHWDRVDTPMHWTKPKHIFVDSLSDLFHEDIPDHFISSVYITMEATPRHVYQVLTKRPERMRTIVNQRRSDATKRAHVWHGVSVENKAFLWRIDMLRQTSSAIRFLSIEPLLQDLGDINLSGIALVIVGGESGPHRRPTNPDWVRSVRDQCVAAGVAFFFKQWGGRTPKSGGRELDGRTWDDMPHSQSRSTERTGADPKST